jgi:hypothetical protein
MKKILIGYILLLVSITVFSQAREDSDDSFKKVYSILITEKGKVQHVVKQGALISSKVDRKVIKGRWYFKAYPDVVVIVGETGQVLGEIELNKEMPLRIATPQKKSGMSVGIGIGPVSVSSLGGGSGLQNFDMKKYHAELDERLETKQEKMDREYYEKKRLNREKKEAEKAAKKAARKNKKK